MDFRIIITACIPHLLSNIHSFTKLTEAMHATLFYISIAGRPHWLGLCIQLFVCGLSFSFSLFVIKRSAYCFIREEWHMLVQCWTATLWCLCQPAALILAWGLPCCNENANPWVNPSRAGTGHVYGKAPWSVTASVTWPFLLSHSLSRPSAFCFPFSVPTHTRISCLFVWAVWWKQLGAGE